MSTPNDLPRRLPGDHLFADTQTVVDVAPTAVHWIRSVAAATDHDDDTLIRVREGLVKL